MKKVISFIIGLMLTISIFGQTNVMNYTTSSGIPVTINCDTAVTIMGTRVADTIINNILVDNFISYPVGSTVKINNVVIAVFGSTTLNKLATGVITGINANVVTLYNLLSVSDKTMKAELRNRMLHSRRKSAGWTTSASVGNTITGFLNYNYSVSGTLVATNIGTSCAYIKTGTGDIKEVDYYTLNY
jgi:hypothetical protein